MTVPLAHRSQTLHIGRKRWGLHSHLPPDELSQRGSSEMLLQQFDHGCAGRTPVTNFAHWLQTWACSVFVCNAGQPSPKEPSRRGSSEVLLLQDFEGRTMSSVGGNEGLQGPLPRASFAHAGKEPGTEGG
eukprot:1160136-Pelagomonas_calceolata.AAC.9